jgi:hypothetical protein
LDSFYTFNINSNLTGNPTFANVVYGTSDPNVAQVDNGGNVTLIDNGTATLRVSSLDGQSDTMTVTVSNVTAAPQITNLSAVTYNPGGMGVSWTLPTDPYINDWYLTIERASSADGYSSWTTVATNFDSYSGNESYTDTDPNLVTGTSYEYRVTVGPARYYDPLNNVRETYGMGSPVTMATGIAY